MAFDAAAYARAYHARRVREDPEYRARRKIYAATQNAKRKQRRAVDPEYDAACKERERVRSAKRELDPEYRAAKAERAKNWRRPTLAQRRMWQSTRRARKLNQFIEDVDPQVVYSMPGGMCGICKEFIQGDFHVDHVVPLSRGGKHGYINVQPAHPKCNFKKGNRV